MEFNYIRACLPAPFPPAFPYFSRSPSHPSDCPISSLCSHSFLPFPFRLAFPFSSITSFVARCFPPPPSFAPSRYLPPSEDASRGLHSRMKIFKFRRLVQRKLLLSPARPTAAPRTHFSPFRQLSPPELHPFLVARLPFRAVYSASGYSNAVRDYILPPELIVVHHRWVVVSLYLSFFPSRRNTWSRQLPCFL